MKKEIIKFVIRPLLNSRVNSTIALFIGKEKVFKNSLEQIENTTDIITNGDYIKVLTFPKSKVNVFKSICKKNNIQFSERSF